MGYMQPKPIGKIRRDSPRKRRRSRFKLPFHFFTLLTLLVFGTVLFSTIYSYFYYYRHRPLVLKTSQKKYCHYDFVVFQLDRMVKSDNNTNLVVFIEKNNVPLASIGGIKGALLTYNKTQHQYEARWPVPWNAPGGTYAAKLVIPRDKKAPQALTTTFEIERPAPAPVKPGLGVLTLETTTYLEAARIKNPDGTFGGWENIFSWADFLAADTIWYLAGQTASWGARIDNDYPWVRSNTQFVPKFAKAAHKHGLKFGAWVACYLTFGDFTRKADYNYSYNYDGKIGTCVPTRSISIGDNKRRNDIIKLLKYLAKIPEVDYIGLDYIRNAIGGYEMVDQFVTEMRPDLPGNWKKLDKMGRMCWLGREVQNRQKMRLVDQWNWWRAQYIAHIVKEIKEKVNTNKPLWCYTLSWEKGWQHGQDPIMMNDAGADIDAVMLYECDRGQFNDLIKDWSRYVGKNQVNLIAGDVVDWNLHQNITNPPGPQELYDRMMTAHHKMTGDGRIKGFFWHDLARGLWGRLGPYSVNEWAIAGAAAISSLRNDWGLLDIETSLDTPETMTSGKEYEIKIKVKNRSRNEQRNLKIEFLTTPYMNCLSDQVREIKSLGAQEVQEVIFTVKARDTDAGRAARNMLAFSCQWDSNLPYHKLVTFKYLPVQ